MPSLRTRSAARDALVDAVYSALLDQPGADLYYEHLALLARGNPYVNAILPKDHKHHPPRVYARILRRGRCGYLIGTPLWASACVEALSNPEFYPEMRQHRGGIRKTA